VKAITLQTSTGRLTLIESPYFVVVQFEAIFGPLKVKKKKKEKKKKRKKKKTAKRRWKVKKKKRN